MYYTAQVDESDKKVIHQMHKLASTGLALWHKIPPKVFGAFLHAVRNNSNFWQGGWHKWHWASKSEENFAQEINVSLMYSCL